MSKELKRLKDWLDGYESALPIDDTIEMMASDIKHFIDTLIREGEIAEHEAKKFSRLKTNSNNPEMLAEVERAFGLINEDQR